MCSVVLINDKQKVKNSPDIYFRKALYQIFPKANALRVIIMLFGTLEACTYPVGKNRGLKNDRTHVCELDTPFHGGGGGHTCTRYFLAHGGLLLCLPCIIYQVRMYYGACCGSVCCLPCVLLCTTRWCLSTLCCSATGCCSVVFVPGTRFPFARCPGEWHSRAK